LRHIRIFEKMKVDNNNIETMKDITVLRYDQEVVVALLQRTLCLT